MDFAISERSLEKGQVRHHPVLFRQLPFDLQLFQQTGVRTHPVGWPRNLVLGPSRHRRDPATTRKTEFVGIEHLTGDRNAGEHSARAADIQDFADEAVPRTADEHAGLDGARFHRVIPPS
jgi:hypothetical protein